MWTGIREAVRAAVTDDRRLAGALQSLLLVASALAVALMVSVPGAFHAENIHEGRSLLIAALVLAYALGSLWIPWERLPAAAPHIPALVALPTVMLVAAWTGGQLSPVRLLVSFVVVWAACFCRPPAIVGYTLLSSLTFTAPYFYGEAVPLAPFVREQIVVVFGLGAIALTIALLRRGLDRARHRHLAAAEEQRALLRVATAVADGVDADELHRLVATEVGLLFGGQAGATIRVEDGHGTVMGTWCAPGAVNHPPGMRFPLTPASALEQAVSSRSPVRVRWSEGRLTPVVSTLGYRETVVAPIVIGHRVWGGISVATLEEGMLSDEVGARLDDFGALIATAVENAEARDRLADQAFSDPLTGLANHRAFHERLASELERAQRTGRALSLVLLDVDAFKAVNDGAGHEAGDQVLADLAERLRGVARGGDLLARIGGDEFGWLLPDTAAPEALQAVERARAAVASAPLGGRTAVTISAGICDLAEAGDADALFRLADGALYWSKAHGRDRARVYDPETVRELSAQERADQLAHHQALLGIRALARAIDAKDTTTLEHSTRVAELATALARERGWPAERVSAMEEAALVHDVGKIGIPDAVLLKPSRLTAEEYEVVKRHAALGAEIVEDVLSAEQVTWIRGHHERPDGRGYPDGLVGDELTEGAALLALADAFDVMTAERPYSTPKDPAVALDECRELVGAQFTAQAVAALEVVLAARAAGATVAA